MTRIRTGQSAVPETLSNLASSPYRTIILAITFAAIGAAVVSFTGADVGQVSAAATAQNYAGKNVLEIVNTGPNGVSARKCDAISTMSGVTAAGAVMSSTPIRFATAPDTTYTMLEVTPGFIHVAWPTLPQPGRISTLASTGIREVGIVVGESVSFRLADDPKSFVTVTVEALSGLRSRVATVNRSLVVVAPPGGAVRSCLVETTQPTHASVGAALQGWFGPETVVKDFLVPNPLARDPDTEIRSRISRFGWMAAGFAIAAIILGYWVARRGEYALYRLLGMCESRILFMLVVETVIVVWMPLQAGALVAATLVGPTDVVTAVTMATDLARSLLLLPLLPLLGVLVLPKKSVLSTLRGR